MMLLLYMEDAARDLEEVPAPALQKRKEKERKTKEKKIKRKRKEKSSTEPLCRLSFSKTETIVFIKSAPA